MAGIPGMGRPGNLPTSVAAEPPVPELNFPKANIMNAGEFQMAPSAAPEIDYDALAAEAVGAAEEIDYDALAAEAVASDPGDESMLSESLGFGDQVRQLPMRLRGSFARSDKEMKQVLEDEYGKGNVRESGGTLEFKLDGKWREFDKGLELGDIADFGRDIVEEVPATLGTLAGFGAAAGTTIASGGAGGFAAPAMVAGGRAAGAVAGQALGDFLAQAMGIERDQDRNAYLEYGLSATLAPLAGAAGDFAARKLAQRAAIKKSAALLPPEQLFSQEIKSIKEGTDDLVQKGLLQNIPGTDTPLILSQTVPSSKVAKEITKKASELPEFEQIVQLQADNFGKAADTFLETIAKNTPETGTGVKFKNAVTESIKTEGRLIGEVRKEFVEAAGNGDLPVKSLQSKLQQFRSDLGFRKGMNAENVAKELADNGFDQGGPGAKIIADKSEKIFEAIFNKEGRLSAKELMGYYTEINGLYGNIVGSSASPAYVQKVRDLRRMITDELNDKVRVVAGDNVGASYVKNLEKFSSLQTAREEMAGVLDNNVINSNALARAVFDRGKNGIDRLKATKVLLRDNPELYENVVGQYFNNVKSMSGVVDATGKTNWNKFMKEVEKLGPEMMEEAFGANHKKTFESFATVSQAIENGKVPLGNTPEGVGFLKNLAIAFATGSPFAAGSAGIAQLKGLKNSDALVAAVNKQGIDNFLKTAPKESKPRLRRVLNGLVDMSLKTAAGPNRPGIIGEIGAGTRGIVTREAVRNMDSRPEEE